MPETNQNQIEPALRAVAFDLDGLISNTEDLYEQAGIDLLARRGKTYDDDLRQHIMGRPVVDSIRLIIEAHALPDSVDSLMAECGGVLQELIASSLAPMPGVYELINDLQAAEIPIAVATSALPEYADNVLTRLKIKDRFQFILTAADVSRGKPDPEIYLLTAKRFGIAPSQMMVLEDSSNGCRAAVAAGTFAVAVPNRHTRGHQFPNVALITEALNDPRIRAALHIN